MTKAEEFRQRFAQVVWMNLACGRASWMRNDKRLRVSAEDLAAAVHLAFDELAGAVPDDAIGLIAKHLPPWDAETSA